MSKVHPVTKILSIDQSLAKCAFTVFENGEVIHKELAKTGSNDSKTKKVDVEYFKTVEEQVHEICVVLERLLNLYKPEKIIFEALSFGSAGNATRNLAQLFGAMNETIMRRMEYERSDIVSYAPTSLKAFARKLLPEEEQTVEGKDKRKPKLVPMDKKLMVRAAEQVVGQEYFKGYNFSTGKDDLADSYLLGYKYITESS